MRQRSRCKAISREPLVVGLLAAVSVWAVWAGVACSAEWADPPAIVMQDCVEVQRFMGPNPYSAVPNDFALVTSYQENRAESARIPDKAFYLLNSVLVDQQHRTGVVYFSSLIVNISRADQEVRRVSFWLLADTNGDGKLDKAVYRETEVSGAGEEKTVSEVQATDEELKVLQAYYDEATSKLNEKADDTAAETCNREADTEAI